MILVWATFAVAEIPPPDYPDSLMETARNEVSRIAHEQGVKVAEEFVARWERTVGPDARVEYELGLAWRLAGEDKTGRAWLDRALKRDPLLVAARYDRGEILLADGDLAAAEADFKVVVEREPKAWPGLFRMADVAARRKDVAGFEAHLLSALRYGFPLASVGKDPHWRSYLQDPELGPVLRKLAGVYAPPDALDSFEGP